MLSGSYLHTYNIIIVECCKGQEAEFTEKLHDVYAMFTESGDARKKLITQESSREMLVFD